MASGKPGAREAAKAEKEADIIIASLGRASEAATATTLATITETLRHNTPLMYHIAALLQNEEWRGVLEAAALGKARPTESSGEKPVAEKKLRGNVKKFEHLPRQPGAAFTILSKIKPTIYTDDMEELPEEELMFHVCRLLRCRKNTPLPTETHSVPATVEQLAEACKQHYESVGDEDPPVNLERLRAGYYNKGENGKRILCVLDEGEDKTSLDSDYADDVQIENPLDIMTEIKITTKGRETKVDSVQLEFEQVPTVRNMPALLVEWNGALFGAKKAVTTPQKKGSIDPSPTASSNSPFISKAGANLSQALRKN